MGVINLPKYVNGSLVKIFLNEKTGLRIGKMRIPDSLIAVTKPIDSIVVLSNTDFSFSFSGDISKADQHIQIQLENVVSNNSAFFLSNYFDSTVSQPIQLLNYNNDFRSTLKSQQEENSIFMMIQNITYANKFEFRIKQGNNSDANLNLVSIGDFKVKVNYACQNSIQINASNGGVFYKALFFKYDKKSDSFMTVPPIDLSTINLTNGIF